MLSPELLGCKFHSDSVFKCMCVWLWVWEHYGGLSRWSCYPRGVWPLCASGIILFSTSTSTALNIQASGDRGQTKTTNKQQIREREGENERRRPRKERETSLSLFKRCQCHTPVLSWASCQTPVSVETVAVSDRWQDGCQYGRDGVRAVGSYQTGWIVRVCVCVF